MTHFVSASCGDPCSVCGERSTHKLGEEIMHDEPCMQCGSTWRYYQDEEGSPTMFCGPARNDCKAVYHLAEIGGPYSQRHNLTAYVCCKHFTMIVGKASGCFPPCSHQWVSIDDGRGRTRGCPLCGEME